MKLPRTSSEVPQISIGPGTILVTAGNRFREHLLTKPIDGMREFCSDCRIDVRRGQCKWFEEVYSGLNLPGKLLKKCMLIFHFRNKPCSL